MFVRLFERNVLIVCDILFDIFFDLKYHQILRCIIMISNNGILIVISRYFLRNEIELDCKTEYLIPIFIFVDQN